MTLDIFIVVLAKSVTTAKGKLIRQLYSTITQTQTLIDNLFVKNKSKCVNKIVI